MENSKYVVSSTPHIRSGDSIDNIMKDVVIALVPACLAGVYYFGLRALFIIALCVCSSVLFEYLYQRFTKQTISIGDYSAVVTGMLLAMNLPVSSPFWIPIVGSLFAIVIVKQLFGGLGQNFMNPALAARAFLLAAYPVQMTSWTKPVGNALSLTADAVSSATPLGLMKSTNFMPAAADYINAFIGNRSGCIGETCVVAILIGGAYLLYKQIISWRIPTAFIGTVFVLTWVFGRSGFMMGFPFYEIIIGGVMLGAFFMATDYSSSPVTPVGQLIMGVGCGLITAIIRIKGGYPEGVSYSILLMNLFVPLIDKYVRPKVFGIKKEVAKRG